MQWEAPARRRAEDYLGQVAVALRGHGASAQEARDVRDDLWAQIHDMLEAREVEAVGERQIEQVLALLDAPEEYGASLAKAFVPESQGDQPVEATQAWVRPSPTEEMGPHRGEEGRWLGWASAALVLGGLVVAFGISLALGPDAGEAPWLGFCAVELLACVTGALSWRQTPGRVGLVSSVALVGMAVLAGTLFGSA